MPCESHSTWWDLGWHYSKWQFLSLWQSPLPNVQWRGKKKPNFGQIICPALPKALYNPTALSPASLPENIDLYPVTCSLESSGTIPNPHDGDAQLSSGQFGGIQFNPECCYSLPDVEGYRQHCPDTPVGCENVTQGQTCHQGQKLGQKWRRCIPCQNGTPKGRGQKVPTESVEFHCKWT